MPTTIKELPKVSRLRSIMRASKFVHNPIPILKEYEDDLGDTYGFHAGGMTKGVLSTNPDFIQHVLQKNNKNYPKSSIQKDTLGYYIGWGLLTIDGDHWLRQRRLIQPGFHREKLKGLHQIMQTVTEEATAHLDAKADTEASINIYEEMMDLAFKMVAKSFFSTSIRQDKLERLEHGISVVQSFVIKQIRQPFLNPWFKISGQVKKHKKIAIGTSDVLREVIEERRESQTEHDDLLDMLLKVRYEDTGETMSMQQLLDESLIIFVAGHETTANALAWTLYLLSQHPDIVTKLRAEHQQILGNRKPEFTDFPQLVYTTQVINESMRLYPPAWITDRVALEDEVVNGYKVEKGMIVIPYIYGAHHSAKNWDKPEEFRPERFAKARRKERHNFAFLPFGGGPRLCIGNNFAMMEMQMILVHLLRKFDFTLDKNQMVELQPLVTLRPKNGIQLTIRNRVVENNQN